MKVRDVMSTTLVMVSPEAHVIEATQMMAEKDVRHLLVMKDGLLLGVLSSRDVPNAKGETHEHMSRKVVTVGPDEGLQVAAARMAVHKIGCLPVLEGGNVVGIVTTYDLLDVLVQLLGGQ